MTAVYTLLYDLFRYIPGRGLCSAWCCKRVAQQRRSALRTGEVALVSACGHSRCPVARRRQLLPGLSLLELRSLTTAAVLPNTTTAPHPPPATARYPLATSLGPAVFCDALSCSLPSPLRPRRPTHARRPLVAAPHTPAQGLSEPPASARIARSANPRPHKTSTPR
jgi:hypothetical protein